ncbi:MAG: hypothetical protein NC218_03395 [Acetobacter sp.]|nr:hypothetical protein [Acetobacter sp.]
MDNTKYTRFINKKHKDNKTVSVMELDEITAPVTILFAPNGCGKSTTLAHLQSQAKAKGIEVVDWKTSQEDHKKIIGSPMHTQEKQMEAMSLLLKSEGEGISQNMSMWADEDFLPKIWGSTDPILILFDETDSGLSYDRMLYTLSCLINICANEMARKRDIKMVFSSNSYEMMKAMESEITQFIWLPTKEVWTPKNYEEFIKPYQRFYDKHLALLS